MGDRRHLGRVAICAVSLFVAVCRDSRPKVTDAEWASWLDRAVQKLPKVIPALPTSSGWRQVQSPDGLRFGLSADYRKRNDYGCWTKNRWRRPEWRDVCVRRVRGWIEPPEFVLKPRPQEPQAADEATFEDWRAEAFSFGSRRAIVERAKGTGGFEGAQRERMASIFVELSRGEWAVLHGRTGEDEGYDELISVASTIEPAEASSP
jgi:hypothetical protein